MGLWYCDFLCSSELVSAKAMEHSTSALRNALFRPLGNEIWRRLPRLVLGVWAAVTPIEDRFVPICEGIRAGFLVVRTPRLVRFLIVALVVDVDGLL